MRLLQQLPLLRTCPHKNVIILGIHAFALCHGYTLRARCLSCNIKILSSFTSSHKGGTHRPPVEL